jgi:hypothetical protein
MTDQRTSLIPILSPDRRITLVNEIWEAVAMIVEEIDLDAMQKSELILELGKCRFSSPAPTLVSLRFTPEIASLCVLSPE